MEHTPDPYLAVCEGILFIWEFGLCSSGMLGPMSLVHHFLLGGTGRSRGPLEAVPIPGIWIRIVMGERIFVVCCYVGVVFWQVFF